MNPSSGTAVLAETSEVCWTDLLLLHQVERIIGIGRSSDQFLLPLLLGLNHLSIIYLFMGSTDRGNI